LPAPAETWERSTDSKPSGTPAHHPFEITAGNLILLRVKIGGHRPWLVDAAFWLVERSGFVPGAYSAKEIL